MSTIPVNHPPNNCFYCEAERLGIQEGRVVFKCGSVLHTEVKEKSWQRSLKCKETEYFNVSRPITDKEMRVPITLSQLTLSQSLNCKIKR